ncbi:MAG: hypothetical protein QNJ53_17770 [Pleurocapsa sp. MO_192.B19]|nr:hypothetical protein [Pleurocapsa sp. MO_192.B19]
MIDDTLEQPKNSWDLKDYIAIGICIFGSVYFVLGEPRVLAVLAFSSFTTLASLTLLNFLGHKLLQKKIKWAKWHFLALALGITLCFTGLEQSSHALVFEALEEAMTDVLTATGDSIDESIITGLFTFFRVVLVLAFIGGMIFAITQGLQGSDWRPIVNAMGIGVGVILAIEVLTNLVVGT